MKEKIAFRADGNTTIGLGHIYNSLAVIEALQKFSVEVHFITKNYPESVAKLKQAGCLVETIDHSLSEAESFRKTIQILKEKGISCLVTDLLEIKKDYSSELAKNKITCVSIDILGKIALKSDIIINRTTIQERFRHYDRTGYTKYYLGPEYVSLRSEFLNANKEYHEINKKAQNLLLCFGGGDEFNLSARVTWILNKFAGIKTTIVLGAAFNLEEELQEIISQLPEKPTVIKDAKNIKELLLQSDLAVCAGGSILYELAVTGTPAIIIPMNDHQVENAEEFAKLGSIISVGLHSEIEDADIENAIKESLEYPCRMKMSEAGRKITDGRGAERIAEIIYKHLQEKSETG
ncbi:MAG: UDP-2,4-diacetamido-2,4,6-trideoxy-beta-L-altropyranose hydrolase [Nanoarchaeota archaeon]